MKRLLWIGGLVVAVVAAGLWYVGVDVAAAPPRLTLAPVSRGTVISTIEATGTSDKRDALESLLGKFDLREMVRTGKVVMARGGQAT